MPSMLDPDERNKLQAALEEAMVADCRETLANCMPPVLAPRLLAGGECRTLVKHAIRICEEHGYQSVPPSICYFLVEIRTHVPNHEAWLESLELRLRTPPPDSDPFVDLIIRNDIPFLDRAPLREALRRLLAARADRPILVINGPAGCGKSFTFRFIDHLCRRQSNLKHCAVTIATEQDRPTVRDVAKELMTKLGGKAADLTPQDTNSTRWPQELANDVWGQLNEVSNGWDGTWILLLDGFTQAKIDSQIQQFIAQLAANLRTGVGSHRHRLVLTDFDETMLAAFRQDTRRIKLDAMPIAHTRDEIIRMLQRVGRNADASVLADEVIAGLTEPIENLSELGLRCEDLLQSIAV